MGLNDPLRISLDGGGRSEKKSLYRFLKKRNVGESGSKQVTIFFVAGQLYTSASESGPSLTCLGLYNTGKVLSSLRPQTRFSLTAIQFSRTFFFQLSQCTKSSLSLSLYISGLKLSLIQQESSQVIQPCVCDSWSFVLDSCPDDWKSSSNNNYLLNSVRIENE